MAQRLEGQRSICPQRMMFAAHGQHGGAGRIAFVKEIDLATCITPELHGNQ